MNSPVVTDESNNEIKETLYNETKEDYKMDILIKNEDENFTKHKVIKRQGVVSMDTSFDDPVITVEICALRTNWYKPYLHYFIKVNTNQGVRRIGFEWVDNELAVVAIACVDEGKCLNKKEMITELFLNRLNLVLGMNNYSLLYRNCEHIARFLYDGVWYCSQINRLHKWFGDIFKFEEQWIDQCPIPEPVDDVKYELDTNSPLKYVSKVRFKKTIDPETTNILLFGPTGVGKSNLINHLSGVRCCRSKRSPDSITQMVEFVNCVGKHKSFNLIDTIGVNHSYDWQMIFQGVKDRIGKDIPVFEAWLLIKLDDRLSDDNRMRIYKFYQWVKKQKKIRAHKIIFTHCRHIYKEEERERMKLEMLKVFDVMKIERARYSLVDLFDETSWKNREIHKVISDNIRGWILDMDQNYPE